MEYQFAFFVNKVSIDFEQLEKVYKEFNKDEEKLSKKSLFLHLLISGVQDDSEEHQIVLNSLGIELDEKELSVDNQLHLNRMFIRHFWIRESKD